LRICGPGLHGYADPGRTDLVLRPAEPISGIEPRGQSARSAPHRRGRSLAFAPPPIRCCFHAISTLSDSARGAGLTAAPGGKGVCALASDVAGCKAGAGLCKTARLRMHSRRDRGAAVLAAVRLELRDAVVWGRRSQSDCWSHCCGAP
jgi:hypothetical protein